MAANFADLCSTCEKPFSVERFRADAMRNNGPVRFTCCGKSMHEYCMRPAMQRALDQGTLMSWKTHCPWCGAKSDASINKQEQHARNLRWAKGGKAWAMSRVGQDFMNGGGVAQSFEMARLWFEKAAGQGDPMAQHNLGLMHEMGKGVPTSKENARLWFEKAAKQGCKESQHNLASMHKKGEGGPVSLEAARIWYARAAAQGFQDSQNVLGVFYALGQGGPKSKEHAIFWWTYTADKQEWDFSNAQNFQMLKSECFACGAPERNLGDGKKMQRCEMCECAFYCDKQCQLAAWTEGGHAATCKKIQALRVKMFEARIEVKGLKGEDEDHAADVEGGAAGPISATGEAKTGVAAASTPAASAAASEGEESSANVCSICLEILPKWAMDFERFACCGKGLHYECAIQLYESACGDNCPMCRAPRPASTEEHIIQCLPWANKGKVWAMHQVGRHYREAQSLETARLWFEKAAESGLAEAQFDLGLSYHGVGGFNEVSMENARFWFERAAEQGYHDAQYNLGQMQLEGRGGPVMMEAARCWFEKAAEAERSEAQFELAYMHSHGQGGLTVSKEKARFWYEKSACQEGSRCAESQNNLGLLYAKGLGGPKSVEHAMFWYGRAAKQGYKRSVYEHKALESICFWCGESCETVWRCSLCRCANYCNKECQKAAWGDGHKITCKAIRALSTKLDKPRPPRLMRPEIVPFGSWSGGVFAGGAGESESGGGAGDVTGLAPSQYDASACETLGAAKKKKKKKKKKKRK